MRQSFGPRHRIRRRTEFQRVYDQGRRVHGRFMTLVILRGSSQFTRLGISATRRLGNAVERNSVKRRIREIFRQGRPPVAADIVVIPRPASLDASFEELAAEFGALVRAQPRRRAPSPQR